MNKGFAKRAFDIVGASIGIVGAAPIILPIAFIMAVDTRSFPIFKQVRMGKDQKPFTIFKIKSMRDTKDENGNFLPDKDRVSKLGVCLRKTRLDELPQLVNVLKGDMSIVGPRPIAIYNDIAQDVFRHTVRPGLTGIAQINKKNILERAQLLKFDHDYVRNGNFILDIKLCLKTPFMLVLNWSDPHYRESAQASHHKPQ